MYLFKAMTSLLLITAVLLWGGSFVATKICLEYLSPAEIIAIRFAMAVPVLLLIVWAKGESFRFLKTHWKPALGCGLVLVVHMLIQVEGMKTTTATNTAWMMLTIPAFIAALAFVFLKERLALRQGIGMVIAAFGVVVLVSRGDLGSLGFVKSYGDWLVLASCVTWAIYTTIGKKLAEAPSLAVTTVIMAIAGAATIVPVAISSGVEVYNHLPSKVIFSLLYLGLFCFALAYWIWIEGLKRKTAGGVGAYIYFEPLSTMLIAPYVLGESITSSLLAGGALVIVGVWLVERRSKRKRKPLF